MVTFKRPKKPKNGHGTIDYSQRLWQHSSTEKGIAGSTWMGCFAYGYRDEWALILKHADWIEFQDRTTQPVTFYRISVAVAVAAGEVLRTLNGERWCVPLECYTVVVRSLD